MLENDFFKIQANRIAFDSVIKSSVNVWYKSYNYHTVYVNMAVVALPAYIHFGLRTDNKDWKMYVIEKSFFVDFYNLEENDLLLYLIAHNHSTKYLKFIVGLYKLYTNQISTSELEQLVLDNIEDLL